MIKICKSVTSHALDPLLCHKPSHLLGPPLLERDVLNGRPLLRPIYQTSTFIPLPSLTLDVLSSAIDTLVYVCVCAPHSCPRAYVALTYYHLYIDMATVYHHLYALSI